MENEKHVVIVGAGFVGLNCAKLLGNAKGIRVTVLDQTGAALIIARVTLVDGSGRPRTVQVDDKGVATFADLETGTFQLKAEAESFQSYDGSITLKKGSNAVSIRLPLAGLTEQVVVTEDENDSNPPNVPAWKRDRP